MEFKGTKGEWFVGQVVLQDGVDSLVVSPVNQVKYDKGYRLICDISPMENHDDEDIANAQLISKAPEMLDMLKELISHYEDIIKQDFSPFALRSDIDKAREIIKEATNV